MRTESFKQEFRKIRNGMHHVFHGHMRGIQEVAHGAPREEDRGFTLGRRVRDVMEARPVTVGPECPLRQALALMIEHRISGVPVVDADGFIVGALNEGDLLKVFWERDATSVASVMTRDPVTIPVDTALVDVVDRLMSSDFRRVLVHDRGRLVGVITRAHLMPTILEVVDEQLRARGVPGMPTGPWVHH
jgi:CBS domain-containing protein